MTSRIQIYSIIGHRGAPMLLPPGNTLASLQRAVEAGAQMLEVDVRSTADQILVTDHEAVRYFNGEETPLRERTYKEWKGLPSDMDVPLPTLSEVFAFARKEHVGLMLDFKEPGMEASLARAIRQSGLPMERLLVAGADDTSRRIFRALDPRIPLSLSLDIEEVSTVTSKLPAQIDTDAVTWHHKLLTPPIVKVLQMRGIVVYAGTINLADEMRRLIHVCKVNGVMTDSPDVLKTI